MLAPAECADPAEQYSQIWLHHIREAAMGLEETFVCGGSETCTQPVRVVYKGRDAQKIVKSLAKVASG